MKITLRTHSIRYIYQNYMKKSCNKRLNLFEEISDWHSNTLKSSYSNLWHECQAVRHAASKFLKEWIALWYCFPHRQFPTDPSLLQSRHNRKQTKHMREINYLEWWQFTSLSLSLFLLIYQYKYIPTAIRAGHKVNFSVEFKWFEFRVFLLFRRRLKNPVCSIIYP